MNTGAIRRGDTLVLLAILVTLIADAITEIVRPYPSSYGGNILLAELVRVPITKAGAFLPRTFVEWVKRFNSDWLFARVPWLNPSDDETQLDR